MSANIISKRINVPSGAVWVPLAVESVIVDVTLRAANNNQIVIRQVGDTSVDADTAALLPNANITLIGVDLSQIEVATSSGVPQTLNVIAQSAGIRR